MDYQYENEFLFEDDYQSDAMFDDYRIDVENFLSSKRSNIYNSPGEYELELKDFKIDKSKIITDLKKGNINDCEIHELHSFNEKNNQDNNFFISSSNLKDIKQSSPNRIHQVSEKMKYKRAKTKAIFEEKKINNNKRTETNLITNQNYLVDQLGKINILTDKLDPLSKKEIKIIRNRISAQKSRDKKKDELNNLRNYSDNLLNENNKIKKTLELTQKELSSLKKTNICEKCKKNILENDLNISNTSNDTRSSIVDMSIISRTNYSNITKVGILSGLMLILLFLGSLLIDSNNKVSQDQDQIQVRKLKYNDNLQINNNLITSYPFPSFTIPSEDRFVLEKKRNAFILNLVNKIRVANSIDKLNNAPKNNYKNILNFDNKENKQNKFLNIEKENKDNYHFPICVGIENNDLSCKIKYESNLVNFNISLVSVKTNTNIQSYKNPSFNSSIISMEEIELFDTTQKLQNKIQSLFCRDYVSNIENNDNHLDEIIHKKIQQDSKSINDDCMYLHLIIPSKNNNNYNDENIPSSIPLNIEPKLKSYYEIGCKIFEINKIYK